MLPHFLKWDQIPEKEIISGFHGRFVHTDRLTFVQWRIEKGATLPEHFHPHEQITQVLEGVLEMTVDGVTTACEASTVVVIPSNVPHSGRAVTDCRIIDVFQPAREDYQ